MGHGLLVWNNCWMAIHMDVLYKQDTKDKVRGGTMSIITGFREEMDNELFRIRKEIQELRERVERLENAK
jgi:phage-related protein